MSKQIRIEMLVSSIVMAAMFVAFQFLPALAKDDTSKDFAGIVVQISGGWTETQPGGAQKQLHKFDSVKNGGQVNPPAKSSVDDTITIQLIDRSIVKLDGKAGKSQQISLKQEPNLLDGALWERAGKLLFQSPRTYVTTISRELQTPLADKVVKCEGGQINAKDILPPRRLATYRFTLCRITDAGKSSQVSGPFVASIDPKADASVNLGDLGSGLYEMTLLDRNNNATKDQAWILLCSPDKYVQAVSSWQDMVKQVESWKDEGVSDSSTEFLRAYLQSLSDKVIASAS
jgi:hypothetical protein